MGSIQAEPGERPQGWNPSQIWIHIHTQETPGQDSNLEMENVSNKASRRSWERLIQKVYEVDPLICPKCGNELKVIAVITEPDKYR